MRDLRCLHLKKKNSVEYVDRAIKKEKLEAVSPPPYPIHYPKNEVIREAYTRTYIYALLCSICSDLYLCILVAVINCCLHMSVFFSFI